MFSINDLVRKLDGEGVGRVIVETTEHAGLESEQVVTIQLHGTRGEGGQYVALASELTLHSVQLTQLPDSDGKGFSLA